LTGSRSAVAAARATGASGSVMAVRITAAVLCAFGGSVMTLQFSRFVAVFPGGAILAAVLQLPLLVVGTYVLCMLRPIRSPERIWVGAALLWGGAAAIGCSLLANAGLMALWAKAAGVVFAANWADSLTAPLNEETLKACGIVMLVLAAPRLIKGPMDGFIFGALIGLGFQVAENVTYGLNNIADSGATNPVLAVTNSFVVRLASALGSHWTMTAIAGAGVGYIVLRGATGRSLAVATGCLAVCMGMHLLFDAPDAPLAVKVTVNFVVVGAVYMLLRRSYVSRARQALGRDLDAGAITPTEAAGLPVRQWRRRALLGAGSPAEREQLLARQDKILDTVEDLAALAGLLSGLRALQPPAGRCEPSPSCPMMASAS